jgi:hypothetical protein
MSLMFRRFLKVLLTLLLLVLIAAVGLIVMVMNVEDPLSFTILSEKPAEAGAGGGVSNKTLLECEVKNTSIFPMEFLPTTSILISAKDATASTAFLPSSDVESVAVRLTPGQTYKGKLYGPMPLDKTDIHTFSYDWNVRGQIELRAAIRWLDENASFIPDSWLASLFWRTEPSKGRVKHVAIPGAEGAGEKEPAKASVP